MDLIADLWPVYAGLLGAAALNAMFAYGLHATRASGRPGFTAIACGAVAAMLFGLLLRAGAGLAAAGVVALGGAVLLALGFGAATRALAGGQALLASLALVLALHAAGGHLPAVVLPLSPPPPELAVGAALALALGFRALHHGWHGTAALVLRQDARLAAGMGMRAARVRLVGDAGCGMAGGLGGVMLALSQGAVSAETCFLPALFAAAAASVLGGVRHWSGPLLGAVAVLVLARLGGLLAAEFADVPVALALGLMLVLHPEGLTARPERLPHLPRLPWRRAPRGLPYQRLDR